MYNRPIPETYQRQRYSRDISRIYLRFLRYTRDINEIYSYIPEINQIYTRDLHGIYMGYNRDIHDINLRRTRDIARIYKRCTRDMPYITRDMPEILGGSKIPKNSCMNQHQSLSHSSTIYKITCKISSLKLHGKGPLKPRTLYKGNF